MFKNQASQGVYVFARNTTTGAGRTSDAANITAKISKDGGAEAATNDTNPTEIGGGVYWFDLTQAETNCDFAAVYAVSSTADTVIAPVFFATGQDANVTEIGGSAASVSTTVDANVVQISGDSAAADNLESYCDGTTPIPANVTSISGSTSAADILEAVMLASSTGTASGTVTTTGATSSSLTGLGDDALNGCVIVFTTGNAAKEPRRITDYTSSSGAMTWTPAMTTAPAATNAFVILGYIEQ